MKEFPNVRTYGQQQDSIFCKTLLIIITNCKIIPIKSMLYGKVNNFENPLEGFDIFVYPDVLLTVHQFNQVIIYRLFTIKV
jgi:hypothetical protein